MHTSVKTCDAVLQERQGIRERGLVQLLAASDAICKFHIRHIIMSNIIYNAKSRKGKKKEFNELIY